MPVCHPRTQKLLPKGYPPQRYGSRTWGSFDVQLQTGVAVLKPGLSRFQWHCWPMLWSGILRSGGRPRLAAAHLSHKSFLPRFMSDEAVWAEATCTTTIAIHPSHSASGGNFCRRGMWRITFATFCFWHAPRGAGSGPCTGPGGSGVPSGYRDGGGWPNLWNGSLSGSSSPASTDSGPHTSRLRLRLHACE